MAIVKNISGEDRIVPALGGRLVIAGAEVEVDDGEVKSFTQQESVWAVAKSGAKSANKSEG